MFDKLGVKILGLVDNMSFFIGDDGKKYKIFGEGGVKKTAEEFQKEFLGEIPITPEVGKTSDEGKPIVEEDPNNEISKISITGGPSNNIAVINAKLDANKKLPDVFCINVIFGMTFTAMFWIE